MSRNTSFLDGTTTNDSAATGQIGEYIEGIANDSTITGWVNNTFKNIISISLTAGDWDVTGVANWFGGPITGTNIFCEISLVSGSNESNVFAINETNTMPGSGSNIRLNIPTRRISIATTTTVFLVGRIIFTGGTPTAGGIIRARRIR